MNARFALVACFAIAQVSAFAALDASITVKGSKQGDIKGSNADSSSTLSTFQITGLGEGEIPTGKTEGGKAGGNGKVTQQDMHFTKTVDKASPSLFKASASGEHIQVTLNFYATVNGKRTLRSRAVLTNAIITKATLSNANGRDTEQFQLTYQKIEWTYSKQ